MKLSFLKTLALILAVILYLVKELKQISSVKMESSKSGINFAIHIAYKWLSMGFQPFLVIGLTLNATWQLMHVKEQMNVIGMMYFNKVHI